MGLDGAHLDESVCGGPLDRVPAVVSGQARRSAQAEAPVLLQGLGALEPHLHRGTVRPKGRGLRGRCGSRGEGWGGVCVRVRVRDR